MIRSGLEAQRALPWVSSVLAALVLVGCTPNQKPGSAVPKPSTLHSAVNTGTSSATGTANFDAPVVDPTTWSGSAGTGTFTVAQTPPATGGPSAIAASDPQSGGTLNYVIIGDMNAPSGVALAVVSDQAWALGASTIDGVHRHVILFESASGTVLAQASAGTLTLSAAGSAIGQRVTGSLTATMDAVSSQCTVDADCRQGEVCVGGTCVAPPPPPPVCRTNADCSAGEICQSGVCVTAPPPPPACRVDADCSVGEICVSGTCMSPPPPQCRVDADCATGQVCAYGMCVAGPPPGCTSNSQCPRGLVCQGGACVNPTPTNCSQMQGTGAYSATFGPVAVCSAAGTAASLTNGIAMLDDSSGGLGLYIVDQATQTEGVAIQLSACPAAAGTVQLAAGDAELYSTITNASPGLDLFARRTATGGSVTYTQVGTAITGTISLSFAGGGTLSGSFSVQ